MSSLSCPLHAGLPFQVCVGGSLLRDLPDSRSVSLVSR